MSSTRRTRLGAVSALSACLLILGVLAAAPALAAPGCSFNSGTATVNVTADSSALTNVLKRSGDEITFAGGNCGATVTDADTIAVVGGGGSSSDTLVIDLSGGKFVPGLNNLDNQGQAEIEITVSLGSGTNAVIINGTPNNDRWTFLINGVDLNNEGDADVTGPSTAPDTYADLTSASAGSPSVTANGLGSGDTFVQKEKSKETLNGGDGLDRVEYKARTAAVTVEPATPANDGETGEADTVAGDIETIIGGTGNDTLTGSSGTNYLYGGLGNDILSGLDGPDVLNGGTGFTVADDGTDTVTGGNGADTLRGGSNNDILNSTAGSDNVTGGPGNDTENGGSGRDFFDQEASSNGADVISGGAGGDIVSYSRRSTSVSLTLNGVADDGECSSPPCSAAQSAEKDSLASIKNLRGGRGNDVIDASGSTGSGHSLSGSAGNDTLTGSDVGDYLSGGDGADDVSGLAGRDNIFGGDGSDTNLSGGDGADLISGNDGSDFLRGNAGDDRLFGNGGVGDTDHCIDPDPGTYRAGCETKSP